jgi:hypothetical protein
LNYEEQKPNAAHLATGHQAQSSKDQKQETIQHKDTRTRRKDKDSTQRHKDTKDKSKKRFNTEVRGKRATEQVFVGTSRTK